MVEVLVGCRPTCRRSRRAPQRRSQLSVKDVGQQLRPVPIVGRHRRSAWTEEPGTSDARERDARKRAGSSVSRPRSAAQASGLEARDGGWCYALANQTQEATRRQAGARLSVQDVGQT